MMWSDLPPAGNPIRWQPDHTTPAFAGYRAVWVHSGTAALALALIAARLQHPHIVRPEVVLPGYGCPDLVAAAEFAGVHPVLADIGSNDPGYDLAVLPAALSANTVAVVAVNFLGIKERLAELRQIMPADVAIIEDNAQWFPEPADDLSGDFVCLSFGRGKPVSLLGGGALLINELFAHEVLPLLPIVPASAPSPSYAFKVFAYNGLLHPLAYGLVSRNPLFKLGRTVFKPLAEVAAMDAQRQSLLAANCRQHVMRSRAIEEKLRVVIAHNPRLHDVAATVMQRGGRLLRYPVLCEDAEQQSALLGQLQQAGLGATAMYQRVLPEIPNVAERVTIATELRGARSFAERLLTLPVHSRVTDRHVTEIEKIVVRNY